MKRLFGVTFLLIFSGVIIGVYKGIVPQILAGQAKNSEIKVKQSVGNEPEKETGNNGSSAFYGEWIIKRAIAYGKVTAYDEQDIEKLLGKKITYLPNRASFENDVLIHPYFLVSRESKDEFFVNSNVTFEQLGVTANSITRVRIYTNKEHTKPWFSTGGIFYTDNNILIMYDGGVYFALERIK